MSHPRARTIRLAVWIACCTLLLGGTLFWLIALRDRGIIERDSVLIGGWISLGALTLIVWVLLNTTPGDAIRLPRRASAGIIIVSTMLLQLSAVLLLTPVLSEDIVRYRLEGKMWLEGISPFGNSPRDFFARSASSDVIDATVQFGDLATIYPPVAQALFAATRWTEDALIGMPGSHSSTRMWRELAFDLPWIHRFVLWRLLIASIAVATIAVLLRILEHNGDSAWWAVILAWNPLFVLESGGMGHVDVAGLFFMLLAVQLSQHRRVAWGAIALAAASGVKPYAVFLLPFTMRDWNRSGGRKAAITGLLASGLTLALFYLPAMVYQDGYTGFTRTARSYAQHWEANASIYLLIKSTAAADDEVALQRAKERARKIAAGVVLIAIVVAWGTARSTAVAAYWVFLVALLVSPVVYPWYLLWMLCFVPLLRPWHGLTGVVFSATCGISYLLWRSNDWSLSTGALSVEYLPVFAALLIEAVIALAGSALRRAGR